MWPNKITRVSQQPQPVHVVVLWFTTHFVHSHCLQFCEDVDLKQLQSSRKMQQSRRLHNQIYNSIYKVIITLLHCLLSQYTFTIMWQNCASSVILATRTMTMKSSGPLVKGSQMAVSLPAILNLDPLNLILLSGDKYTVVDVYLYIEN